MVGVEDISELLKTADLFFLPSLEEGFGVVAIEAAAAGLPVVATDLPTIREACSPSHHPFMFPPNNDELACKNILSILENQELRKQLSADARKWANNFSIFSSIKQLAHLYENCTQ
jgi:glycosyltransferase EpsF